MVAGAKVLAAIAVTVGLAFAAVYGVRQIYFLGSDGGGRLALYRGLPYDLPFDIALYSEVYAAPVQVTSIPADRRDSALDHTLRFHGDAVDLLKDLQSEAESSAGGKRRAARGPAGGRKSAAAGKRRAARGGRPGKGGGR
jgi:hypothetical protein